MSNCSSAIVPLSSTTKGTALFWAPELLDIDKEVKQSEATDVWAFGMLVFVRLVIDFLRFSSVAHALCVRNLRFESDLTRAAASCK